MEKNTASRTHHHHLVLSKDVRRSRLWRARHCGNSRPQLSGPRRERSTDTGDTEGVGSPALACLRWRLALQTIDDARLLNDPPQQRARRSPVRRIEHDRASQVRESSLFPLSEACSLIHREKKRD